MGIIPEPFASAIIDSLSLLSDDLASLQSVEMLLYDLGYRVTLSDDQYAILTGLSQINTITGLLDDLESAANAGEAVAVLLTTALELADAIASLTDVDAGSISALSDPLDTPGFWADVALALPGYLIVRKLGPVPQALLRLIGVVVDEPLSPDDPESGKRAVLRWERLADFIGDPSAALSTVYEWNTAFRYQELLERLGILALSLGLRTQFKPVPDHLRDHFFAPDQWLPDLYQLELPFFEGWDNTTADMVWLKAGILCLPVPDQPDGPITGLYIANLINGSASAGVTIAGSTTLDVQTSTDASGTMGLILQPGVSPSFDGTAPDLDFALALTYQPDEPLLLVGDADGGRLELGGAGLAVELAGSVNSPEIILRLQTIDGGLRVVIAPGEGDSFVKALLGDTTLMAGADIDIEWSSKTGFHIAGGAELDITIPLNLRILVVTILELHLSLGVGTDGTLDAQATLDASGVLGPFTLTVADIGIQATLTPTDNPAASGTFGGLDIVWAFKPPSGAGAAFDFLGLVYGGGYIDRDPDQSEYSGIITVKILALGITATVIITTQLPDNPDGWSLFVSINVDLGGIPLGFGFTLEKVGGLIGVHRTIDIAVLQAGIRTGILDSILFPEDPIANAPRILSDIESAFPTAQGSFVVGAMLEIGWGTPTIITAALGFIIQIPDIIIALVGQADAVLPSDDFALIEVHFDVLGVLDLTAGTLAIDAGLRDSRMVGYVLTGQMALRASFLTEPSFLLSLGGFHPAFTPPESFPKLDRMGLGLSVGDWLNISLEAYLALTSNTVQFGAGLYLTAELTGFRIEGGTEINTLIQFSPFQFRADLRYYITVSAASVELIGVLITGELSGPNPYHVHGEAHFKLLGLEKEVNIEETIGDKSPLDDVDDVPVLPDVVAALEDPESWRAVDEEGRIGAVLLAPVEDAAAPVAVHPGGSVEVVQRVAPLDVELEHYGNAEIDGQDTLEVTDVEAGESSIAWEFVEDWFAPAQFFDLTQDEKLSSPSFEKMKGGLRLGDDKAEGRPSADTIYDYKQIIRDPEFDIPSLTLDPPFRPQVLDLVNLQAQVVIRSTGKRRPSATQVYQLNPARYTIVERETLTTTIGSPVQDMTCAEARQIVRSGDAADLVVVTSSERQTL